MARRGRKRNLERERAYWSLAGPRGQFRPPQRALARGVGPDQTATVGPSRVDILRSVRPGSDRWFATGLGVARDRR